MTTKTIQAISLALMIITAQLEGQIPTPELPSNVQNSAPETSPDYILGPGDHIDVFVADLPDEFADKTFRIDNAGDVSLPVIGHLHAAGLTTSGLETEAREHLAHVLRNPQVAISLNSYGSQSVYILGALKNPGMFQLEGHKNLFQILALAGGLDYDNSGYLVRVTRKTSRGPIPLLNVLTDPTGQTYSVSIPLNHIIDGTNPDENIQILPGDTVSVPSADLVYAVGSVTKPGGFPLKQFETLSALQVVSLAQGLLKTAASDKAKILRVDSQTGQRTEITVDLKLLMAGKGADVNLQPKDILFVPNSFSKSAGYKTVDSIVGLTTGLAVLSRY